MGNLYGKRQWEINSMSSDDAHNSYRVFGVHQYMYLFISTKEYFGNSGGETSSLSCFAERMTFPLFGQQMKVDTNSKALLIFMALWEYVEGC
jgi:hypothetical protein